MSIVKDRIRPLDPSSLQEFLEPDGGAEIERRGTPSEAEEKSLGDDVAPHVPLGSTFSSSPFVARTPAPDRHGHEPRRGAG
jgi:hypothetical protein